MINKSIFAISFTIHFLLNKDSRLYNLLRNHNAIIIFNLIKSLFIC